MPTPAYSPSYRHREWSEVRYAERMSVRSPGVRAGGWDGVASGKGRMPLEPDD